MTRYPLKHTGRLITDFLPVVFLLLGCFILAQFLSALNLKHKSAGWVKSNGVVHYNPINDRLDYRYLSYQYIVNDVSYSSNRIVFGDYGTGNRSDEWNVFQKYSIDDPVTLYYDPDAPEISVLYRRLDEGLYMSLILSCSFIGSSLIIFYFRSKLIRVILAEQIEFLGVSDPHKYKRLVDEVKE